jgi:hypothetical protein
MSLVKKPDMTEKKVAANERNRRLAHGPATEEGRERIRAAHLHHGFYAQAEEVAMHALGEDPAHLQELLEALWEEWKPASGLQEGLVIHLTRCTWLMNRAVRMQEGYAVRQAQDVNSGRQDRLHARMMRLKMTADSLRLLVQSVAHEHYVTTPADLAKMKNLHQEGVLKEMGEIALALFYQLQAPGTGEDGIDPNENSRRVLVRIKEIFGLSSDYPPRAKVAPDSRQPEESQQVRFVDSDGVHRTPEIGDAQTGVAPDFSPAHADPSHSSEPALNEVKGQALRTANGLVGRALAKNADPSLHSGQALKVGATQPEEKDARYPNIAAAEWEARERSRQLLENILTRQVEICEAQRKAVLKESLAGPSPYERAAEIAPTHPNARLMRRMQDSNFREVRRVTNLLLKLKRHERRMEALEQG